MKYAWIAINRQRWPVSVACDMLDKHGHSFQHIHHHIHRALGGSKSMDQVRDYWYRVGKKIDEVLPFSSPHLSPVCMAVQLSYRSVRHHELNTHNVTKSQSPD